MKLKFRKLNKINLRHLLLLPVVVLALTPLLSFQKIQALAGDGSEESPYLISSCDDFLDITNYPGDFDNIPNFSLTQDIDCSSYGNNFLLKDFIFFGNFNGNNHSITFELDEDADYGYGGASLFGSVFNSSISNLNLKGSISVNTNISVGAIAGEASSITLNHVSSEVDIVSSSGYVGGLIGYADSATISNSSVTGNITGGGSYVGGMVGFVDWGSIENSTFEGNITGDAIVGGLLGRANHMYITKSWTLGEIYSASDNAGGLIGVMTELGSVINQSFSQSDVEAADDYAGGLVGRITDIFDENGTIINSYAMGNVEASDYAGGLVGSSELTYITNSYYSGLVSSENTKGGLIASDNGETTIIDSYWDDHNGLNPNQSAGDNKIGAVKSLPTNQMKLFAPYSTSEELDSAWDFDSVWGMNGVDNYGYPYLQWQGWTTDPPHDGDGVSSQVEANAPNNGDANNDGIADSEQFNVSSIDSPLSDNYITIETECYTNLDVQIDAVPTDNKDPDFDYTDGLVSFKGEDCGDPGDNFTVNLYFYGDIDASKAILRKFNNDSYTTIEDAEFTNLTIGGQQVLKVTYEIVDGGPLDQDGLVDGNFEDPVGVSTVLGSQTDPDNNQNNDSNNNFGNINVGVPKAGIETYWLFEFKN